MTMKWLQEDEVTSQPWGELDTMKLTQVNEAAYMKCRMKIIYNVVDNQNKQIYLYFSMSTVSPNQ